MNTEAQLNRVLKLCDDVLQQPEAERETFLNSVCAGDEKLRASVDSVLMAISNAGDFLESEETALKGTPQIGETFGQYRLLETLGKGGMGNVFLAQRDEDEFQQKVAIKFIRGQLFTPELMERFHAERKILASLNHPYIASLIDGGTSDDGTPYLVMEYVNGIPIDDYCDQHQLNIEERVKLIRKVAMAVQAAHQNLIVHRDLKPSNVLVTTDGIPKLLDFGIAKDIKPHDEDTTGNTTVFGRQAMTPDYASPEQILENRVTTVSDVYTLGVLTYQLLVGERPYHVDTSSHRKMMDSVEGLTVPKPSTRLDAMESSELTTAIASNRQSTVSKLQKKLQGDLDNILLMALRTEPERRYGSVAQFSEDLDRYLQGLPVSARSDSLSYHFSKFLQRNWLPVGAAALVTLSLAVGLLAYATQAKEAERQRDLARLQADNAADTVSFLKDVLFAGNPYQAGNTGETVGDVLDYAEKNLRDQYADQPLTKATILTALSEIFASRGDYNRSATLSSEAVSLYDGQTAVDGNATANAYRVRGLSEYYQSDFENSAKTFDTAISKYLESPNPDWGGLTQAYDQMAQVQSQLTGEEQAFDYYELALSTYREHQIDDPALLVAILSNYGTEHLQKGNYEQADPIFEEAIEVSRGYEASGAQFGQLLSNHAGNLKNLGRIAEASDNYTEATELMVAGLGEQHPETIIAITSHANMLQAYGDMSEAEQLARRSVAAAHGGLDPDDFVTSYAENVGASIICRNGDSEQGLRWAQTSLETREKLLPPGHFLISSGESIVGTCLVAAKEFAKAEEVLLKAYQDIEASRGSDHELTKTTKKRVHELYQAWQKPDRAAEFAIE